MPSYMEIASHLWDRDLDELDELRLEAMQGLVEKTKRPLVVYHANAKSDLWEAQVNDDDVYALMETLNGIGGDAIDLMLHSTGGDPYAADMFWTYLRQKFSDIRVIVPREALSAATTIACGADRLVLARHSFLGPIDLQLTVNGELVAAQEILDQYELLRADFHGNLREFWEGPGRAYFPNLIIQCQNSLAFGELTAKRALESGMFRGHPNATTRAAEVAGDLANHQKHKAHGRRLSRSYLRELGMTIEDLESDQQLQNLVLTVHHYFRFTISERPWLAKLVQNHEGRVYPFIDQELLAEHLPSEE